MTDIPTGSGIATVLDAFRVKMAWGVGAALDAVILDPGVLDALNAEAFPASECGECVFHTGSSFRCEKSSRGQVVSPWFRACFRFATRKES